MTMNDFNDSLVKHGSESSSKNGNRLIRSMLIVGYILTVLVVAGLARASTPDQGQIEFRSEVNSSTSLVLCSRIEAGPAPLQ
jgi:hypothetical protein